MPNHVTNEVNFLGSIETIKELREFCKGKDKREKSPFSFNSFCPMPKELEGTTSPANILSEEEVLEWRRKHDKDELEAFDMMSRPITEKESKEYIKKFGANNWYDWHLNNWGTKWDCYDHRGDGVDCIIFETAWSTPVPAMLYLSNLFPDVQIDVKYADEDFGSNVGKYSLLGGEVISIFQPEYGKDSLKLAMDVLGDMSYWLEDRLIEDVQDESELDEFNSWLVEIAHEEGNLLEEYPLPVLARLQELAIRDEDYKRAAQIKKILNKKHENI